MDVIYHGRTFSTGRPGRVRNAGRHVICHGTGSWDVPGVPGTHGTSRTPRGHPGLPVREGSTAIGEGSSAPGPI